MSFWTPILSTTFQITSTLMFLVILLRLAKVEINSDNLPILIGISIILGFFLFQLVLVLVAIFVVIIIVGVLKRKKMLGSFFPPETDEAKGAEEY